MKAGRRRILTACAVVAAAAALGMLMAPRVLRRVVERDLTARLRAGGWKTDPVRVRRMTLGKLELGGLRLEHGIKVAVAGVRAEYSLQGLLRKRIDDIVAEGVRISVDVTEGWGQAAEALRWVRRGGAAREGAVARVTARPLTLKLVRGVEAWDVRLGECALESDAGRPRLLARGRCRGGRVRAEFQEAVVPGGWTASAELPAAALAGLFRVTGLGVVPHTAPNGTISVHVSAGPSGTRTLALLDWTGLTTLREGAREIGMRDLRVEASGVLPREGGGIAIEAAAKLAELRVGGVVLRDVASDIRADANHAEATLAFRDDPWNELRIHGGISELVENLHAASSLTAGAEEQAAWTLPIDITIDGPVWEANGTGFALASAEVSTRLARRLGAWVVGDIEMVVRDAQVQGAPLALRWPEIRAHVSSPCGEDIECALSSEPFHVGTCTLPATTLTASHATGRLTGDVVWSRSATPVASFTAVLPEAGPIGVGASLVVTSSSWPSGSDDPVLACLRRRTGVDVSSGSLDLQAEFAGARASTAGTEPSARVRIGLRNLHLDRGGIRVHDLAGEAEITDLVRGATPSQRITIGRLELPRTEFTDGEIRIRIEPGWRWFVEACAFRWGGGRVSATGFGVDPSLGQARTTLHVARVELGTVLQLLAGEGVTASGRLEGSMPVAIRWSPRPGIMLGEGRVSATQPGNLRVRDAELAHRWVEQAGVGRGAGAETTRDLRQRLVDSLRNFDYSALHLTVRPGVGGRPSGELEIEGKGAGPRGLPMKLTVRFALLPLAAERG